MNIKMQLLVCIVVLALIFSGVNIVSAKDITSNKNLSINTSRTYRAVLAAVGDYNGDGDYSDEGDLSCTIHDLNKMKDTLELGNTGYEILTLKDKKTTISNLNSRIDWLISASTHNDVALIYYSGHGGQSGGNEYLALYDGNYFDYAFASKISKIKGYVIVILDSCHNHGFVNDVDEIKKSWTSEDIVMITCHDESQSNYGWSRLGYGFFTFCIISSLTSDRENDNVVTIGEFYTNLFREYEFLRERLGIDYEFGANLYYDDYHVKNLEIITSFKNEQPEIDKNNEEKKRGKLSLDLKLTDPDGDDVDLWIYWGYSSYAYWYGPYSSGSKVTKEHTYDKKGTYTIILIGQDRYGSNGYYILRDREITSKQKLLNRFNFQGFLFFQRILQNLNL